MSKIRLKHVITPVELSLRALGVPLDHENQSLSGSTVRVNFFLTDPNASLQQIKLDVSEVKYEGLDTVKDKLRAVLMFKYLNEFELRGEEIKILREIQQDFGLRVFVGPVSDVMIGMEELGFIQIDALNDDRKSWLATLTQEGEDYIDVLASCFDNIEFYNSNS